MTYYPKSWSHNDNKYQYISSIKTFPKFIQIIFTIQITLWFVVLFYVTLPISFLFYLLIVWILHIDVQKNSLSETAERLETSEVFS